MSFNIKVEKVWVSKYEIWAHSTILILNSYNLCTNCGMQSWLILEYDFETGPNNKSSNLNLSWNPTIVDNLILYDSTQS